MGTPPLIRPNDDAPPARPWPIAAGNEPVPPLEEAPAERGGKELGEYVAILRRHWLQIALVSMVLMAIAVAVALVLPPVYRSSATILVQEQEVPPELIRSTITSFADERIQVISQQVLTRAVLLQLIDKYDLYPGARASVPAEVLAERMRKDIVLTTIDSNISDRTSGRRVNATIAFKISYQSDDPVAARNVVNELVTLYLNENAKVRQQSVAETTAFLAQESKRAAERMRAIETNLAEFKRRNAGRLPDSSAVNLQLSERTDGELMRVEREISSLQDRRVTLETQLAHVPAVLPLPAVPTVTGDRPLQPADRLRVLQSQYATASAIYGAEHPDVRRLQREIAALQAEAGPAAPAGDDSRKLSEMEAELARMRERYSDDHPDIQRQRRAIAAMRAADVRASAPQRGAPSAPTAAPKPDNPVYIALVSQIESAKRELVQLQALRDELRVKQRSYDARLMQIPEVEREFRELTRDYENAQARYREFRAKEMQAQVAQELEKDRKGERFSMGEPANLPHAPISPDRTRILLLGLVGSLCGSVGLAWLRDTLDRSIKGPLELARISPVPVLTPVPYIETQDERTGKRRRAWALAALVVVLAAGTLFALDRYVHPLPVIVDLIARRLAS